MPQTNHSIDTALGTRALPGYLRFTSGHALLTKDAERELAEEFARCRVDLWRALLAYGPLTGAILELVDRVAPGSGEPEDMPHDCVLGGDSRSLLERDRDQLISSAIVSDLDGAASNGGRCPHLGVGVDPSDGSFVAYHRAVKHAHARALAARNRLACANLRLVLMIVLRCPRGGMSLEDRIQEGNVGLLRAIDRYDPSLGFRFSTYAVYWVRHALTRALTERARLVRIPAHLHTLNWKCAKVEARVLAQTGEPPTIQALAAELREPPEKIERAKRAVAAFSVDLDGPAMREEGASTAEVLADESVPDIDHTLDARRDTVATRDAFCSLTTSERRILIHRYGLGDAKLQTLHVIGARLGVSRERVRQLQNRALSKLRGRVETSTLRTSGVAEAYARSRKSR